MAGLGMKSLQLYCSEQLAGRLRKEFGEGRVSANVEKILWHYLGDGTAEKKMRLAELQKEIRRFNSDFAANFELVAKEEIPPAPKEEIEVIG